MERDMICASQPERKLRILVLGGTRFVGLHMIAAARARGHVVSMFNRGRTNVGHVKDAEVLIGDRDGELDALRSRKWDAVIDTSGSVPRHIRLSAELLASNVEQYLYVSSVSVYASFTQPNDENSPLGRIADETIEIVDNTTYGPLKALCERAAELAMPERVTTLRPGLVVGPDDNTDRFTYWPARIKRGGEVLAPNAPTERVQIIDVRDLAQFAVHCIELGTTGTFNVSSRPHQVTMGLILNACLSAAANDARLTWVPADFLERHQATARLPWIRAEGKDAAISDTNVERAFAAGLTIRPLIDTVRDTLAWHLSRPKEQQASLKGLAPEQERTVLDAWHASQRG